MIFRKDCPSGLHFGVPQSSAMNHESAAIGSPAIQLRCPMISHKFQWLL
jgi:hypothetical protein